MAKVKIVKHLKIKEKLVKDGKPIASDRAIIEVYKPDISHPTEELTENITKLDE